MRRKEGGREGALKYEQKEYEKTSQRNKPRKMENLTKEGALSLTLTWMRVTMRQTQRKHHQTKQIRNRFTHRPRVNPLPPQSLHIRHLHPINILHSQHSGATQIPPHPRDVNPPIPFKQPPNPLAIRRLLQKIKFQMHTFLQFREQPRVLPILKQSPYCSR